MSLFFPEKFKLRIVWDKLFLRNLSDPIIRALPGNITPYLPTTRWCPERVPKVPEQYKVL